MPEAATVNARGEIVLPASILEALDLKLGDAIVWTVHGNRARIEKKH